MPKLRKKLDFYHNDPASILNKLRDFFGLVYLEDNHRPIIAFLPDQYIKYQSGLFSAYKKNTDYSYSITHHKIDLLDFICLDPEFKGSSQAGFNGGYIGFISYDFAAQQHLKIHIEYKKQPSLYLGKYHHYLKYEAEEWIFYSEGQDAFIIYQNIYDALHLDHDSDTQVFQLVQTCQPRWTKQQYISAFKQVQEYITAGDCYQINLTQEFKAQGDGYLLDCAAKFWAITNAPYAGYLKIDNLEILSCSPELFIDFKEQQQIITRPIKGTMPRYADPILDQKAKNTLINSKKDQAENVMIVDLLRNDFSLYAQKGSVKTLKLFEIESFNQVHHMVSEVQAILNKNISPFQVLLSALPGGSITGAPKIRAMEIIAELEEAARGTYCGSLGYFNFDGTGCWNILIRTIQKYDHDISIWAGGGITIASEQEAEYQECFDKISAMLDLLNTWQRTGES
ncbi:anthranilate synthase component I family protein [Acinetobacter radioresistens]|uniref:anthranilate synthase component I family protein n=1 Tax=Acinetobacter radioresistens TaxID=40216 RepID=UPI0022452924|nr:anthranilate synthase component I family protein [Acinetobacter radioresistens]MCX0333218.1 anthranilate synthase component I family protein [Acinetobacter radioresistens]